jgi:predicted transcriptional regulator
MKAPKTVTFRIDQEKVEKLDAYAAQDDRDRSYLVNEAISRYLEARDFQIARINEGIRQADAGQLIEHDEVMARLRKRGSRK